MFECPTYEQIREKEREYFRNSRIYLWKEFTPSFYEKLYSSCNPGAKLNTIDLAATLQIIEDGDATFEMNPWRLLTCLEILAKEKLIDLALIIRPGTSIIKPERFPRICNLTPVKDLCWSVRKVTDSITLEEAKLPVWSHECGDHHIKRLHARTFSDSMEQLLKRADNDWFKVWYVGTSDSDKEEDPLLDLIHLPPLPEELIVWDETQPLPDDFDAVIE